MPEFLFTFNLIKKRDSGTGAFLWILWNFYEHLFYRIPPDDCFLKWPKTCNFIKRLWHRCFPVNFVKFLRTPFLTEHLLWLLLNFWVILKDLFNYFHKNDFFTKCQSSFFSGGSCISKLLYIVYDIKPSFDCDRT